MRTARALEPEPQTLAEPASKSASSAASALAPLRELRARAMQLGTGALGDAELLALVLGRGNTGHSSALLAAAHLEGTRGGIAGLARETPRSLVTRSALSVTEATRVCAALELGRRAVARAEDARRGAAPMCARAVARWAEARLVHLDHEEVWVLCLDGRSSLSCARQVGRGGVHGCALLARDVLVPVVREAASAFVLVHNHPSGDPTPSREDLDMTRALADAADLLCVPLVDHVVVARGGHRSLFEMGFFERSLDAQGR